jgi:hypothetical protein
MYSAGQAVNALRSKFAVDIRRWSLRLDHRARENVSIAVQPEELSAYYSGFLIATERTHRGVVAEF